MTYSICIIDCFFQNYFSRDVHGLDIFTYKLWKYQLILYVIILHIIKLTDLKFKKKYHSFPSFLTFKFILFLQLRWQSPFKGTISQSIYPRIIFISPQYRKRYTEISTLLVHKFINYYLKCRKRWINNLKREKLRQ